MVDEAWRRRELTRMLAERIPEASVGYVIELLVCQPVDLVISPPRRTRLGYYRSPGRGRPWHQISVNEDLNPYAFLITLLHEIAHLQVARTIRRSVAPHGLEWKASFGQLLKPVVREHNLPDDVAVAIAGMMQNPRASSCADPTLLTALSSYDDNAGAVVRVDDLPEGSTFRLASGRVFRHKQRLRTWHLCEEVATRRRFRVRGSCRAEPVCLTKQAGRSG